MNTTESGGISLADLLREVADRLCEAGIDSDADAELIIAHVLGQSRGRVQALAVMGTRVSDEDRQEVLELAAERAQRIPLQHLTGRGPFRTIELEVGPGVFIPRPETEEVAGLAIDSLYAVPDPAPIALDLCTGSGAIALAIATEMPNARVWAVEQSRDAHAWAKRNVERLGDGRVTLVHGDAAHTRVLLPHLLGRVHVLVSNPPYIPEGMVPKDAEVREHDPELALYSGEDGLNLIRELSREGLDLVIPGGSIILEHAETQGQAIRELLTRDGWRAAATHRDLNLRDRVTTAVR